MRMFGVPTEIRTASLRNTSVDIPIQVQILVLCCSVPVSIA
jgi:hypothetical protein